MKIIHVVGARPQFVKYAPVALALSRMKKEMNIDLKNRVVHSGQHYDRNMSDVFFEGLAIPAPDYHLDVGSGAHGEQTAEIIRGAERVFAREKPDVVVVYGDTNTTLGGALAAVKMHIPVAHVEAGLRSYNKRMPEEVNRILTDRVSTLLFCSCKNAITVLRSEGRVRCLSGGNLMPRTGLARKDLGCDIDHPLAINVGDVMRDVFEMTRAEATTTSSVLSHLSLEPRGYILLTIHRAENTNQVDVFRRIIRFVRRVVDGKRVIFPMHPRTKGILKKAKVGLPDFIQVIEPVPYLDMVALVSNAVMVMTDSGGLQKEAYWAKVPCVTLRNETEWVETVRSGWNTLFENFKGSWSCQKNRPEYYGDGQAAGRMARILLSFTPNGAQHG